MMPISELIEWLQNLPEGTTVAQLCRDPQWEVDVIAQDYTAYGGNPVLTITLQLPRTTMTREHRL